MSNGNRGIAYVRLYIKRRRDKVTWDRPLELLLLYGDMHTGTFDYRLSTGVPSGLLAQEENATHMCRWVPTATPSTRCYRVNSRPVGGPRGTRVCEMTPKFHQFLAYCAYRYISRMLEDRNDLLRKSECHRGIIIIVS